MSELLPREPSSAQDENPPEAKPPAPLEFVGRPRLRWQLVVLVVGMVAIGGAVVFALRGAEKVSPPEIAVSETQVYTEAVVGEPVWANPLLAASQADRDLSALVYSGLTRLDDYGQPIPDLAESWEVSDDGLTYTFHLRSDVIWHDGAPFTANDVAFTMSLLRDPDFPGPADLGTFWRTVETYALNDTTVEFVLTQPLAAFPEYAGIGLLPAHLLGGTNPGELPSDPINLHPVGTGRLWWEAMEEDADVTIVTLRPFDRFYDAARRVTLDGLVLRFYPDAARAFRALGSEAQGVGGVTGSQLEAALNSPDLNVYSARLPVYAVVLFNQQNAQRLPFFQQEEVRSALVMSLNREQIVADALGVEALIAHSPVLPGTWAYHPSLQPVPYDPVKAGAVLDAAGWVLDESGLRTREGVRMSFELLVSNDPVDRKIGAAIQQQWSQLGLDVELRTLSPADVLERLQSPMGELGHDFDTALVKFSQGRLADPDPYPFWHDSQIARGQNYGGFSDHELDEALEVARKDANGVRRAELYRSFQEWFLERGAAVLLYNPVYHYAVSCQVDSVQMMLLVDPGDRFRRLHEWRILPPDVASQACPQ